MTKRARNKSTWGGRREGAGRPSSRAIKSERHKTRAVVTASLPVHVTTRMVDALRRLDGSRLRAAIERAIDLSLARDDFRIVHLDVRTIATRTKFDSSRGARRMRGTQSTMHLELVVEARDKLALARGMQGFQVSAARSLNRLARRSGGVFPDRYRARTITSRAALHALLVRFPRDRRIGTPESSLFV